MSNTPTPPSLYEKFIHGINDIPAETSTSNPTSPPRPQNQQQRISSGNPPTLNSTHIPLVPASGIDPQTGATLPIHLPNTSSHITPTPASRLQARAGFLNNDQGKGMSEGQKKLEHTNDQTQDRQQPKMTKATRDVLQRVRKMIPPLLGSFHKGQMGRVAVIGGSEDYTGAPYFSAMASARLGADMSHVICEPQAAQVIKSYSPNLMVHPLMRQSSHIQANETPATITSSIVSMLPRLHVIVIGPGLGRDPLMHEVCGNVIAAAKEANIPFVLDADGLSIAQTKPDLVMGYRNCVLTPNIVEFGRLCESQGLDQNKFAKDTGEGVEALAKKFGGVTIVQKGGRDWISNGTTTAVCDLEGGYKRSGGQGDTLTGSLATFLGWRKAYLDRIWEHEGDLDEWELLALAAMGGCAITRECSRLAFAKHGRSLQASDLTEQVSVAFRNLFEEGTGQDAKL